MERKLDRLNPSNSTGIAFQRLWQRNCELTEATFDEQADLIEGLAQAVADIQAAMDAAAAADAKATTATTKANAAQASADAVERNDAISTSWPAPGTILSATDAGTDATIAIAKHSRRYSDGTARTVFAGTITGLAYSTKYYVYYDSPNRTGGSQAYVATTDPNEALPGAAPGRHFCGDITTPAAGGAATSGGANPTGGGGGITKGDVPPPDEPL